MTLRETLVIALHTLRGNRLRTVLTSLGIIIGVAAVIILVSLGNGVKAGLDAQLSRLANQITVTPIVGSVPGGGVAKPLTDHDVKALHDPTHAPDIASVTPSTTGSAVLVAGQAQTQASVLGTTADYLAVSARSIAVGSWLTPEQEASNAKVVVLGQQTAVTLWGAKVNLAQVVGAPVRIDHATFKVIGVLEPDGQNDKVAIVPLGASRAYLLGSADTVNQITVKSTSSATVAAATAQLTDILDRQHHIRIASNQDFNVRAFGNLLTQRTQFIGFLTLFTAAIAAISLIVGGIGVANIMLVSVTERTREIGIRKAIGARSSAILTQFLIEAIILTGLGGLVGVIVGLGITLGGGLILTTVVPAFPAPIVTTAPIVIAFAVSLAIGLVAGGYPANRAARLHPIQALRHE